MKDIKEISNIVAKTANYYQIPIDEVLKWIKEEITDIGDQNSYHFTLKNQEIKFENDSKIGIVNSKTNIRGSNCGNVI